MIFGLLFNLALLGAIGYGISRLLQNRGNRRVANDHADVQESVVRLIRLTLLLGAVVLVAEGLAQGIGDLLRRADDLPGDPATLARALAFTIVGVPTLVGISWWTRRQLRTEADERTSAGWLAFVTITALLAAVLMTMAWYQVLRAVLGAPEIDHRSIGAAATWTAVWVVAWRLWSDGRTDATDPDLHLVCGSALGTVLLAVGVGGLVDVGTRRLYESLLSSSDRIDVVASLRDPLALASIGGALWAWYWLMHMARGRRTTAWHGHVLLLGVLGSLITLVVGSAVAVHAALQWWLGNPTADEARVHFDVVPGAAGAIAVGALGWGYHRAVLGRRDRSRRSEIDRMYEYLAASVGLVATLVGITVGIASLIAVLVRPDGRPVANAFVLAGTLIVVGLPIWAVYWRGIQRRVDHAERISPSRRTSLVLLFGASAVTALISMVVLLFIVFEGLTRGNETSPTLYRVRVPLGLVLALGSVAGYHGIVARRDRRAIAIERAQRGDTLPPSTVRDVVIVAPNADECAAALRSAGRVRVQVWRPTTVEVAAHVLGNGRPAALDTAQVMAALATVSAQRVLLIARGDGEIELIPFEEHRP